MKLIIAGSRTLKLKSPILSGALAQFNLNPVEIVEGGASGVDSYAGEYAEDNDIKRKIFYADWDQHGRAAGPIRNRQMAEYADVLLLIWDGTSRGSASMKAEMEKQGKPVHELIIRSNK